MKITNKMHQRKNLIYKKQYLKSKRMNMTREIKKEQEN